MLEIKNVSKTFNPGTINEKHALTNLSLSLGVGDFVTVIGGNAFLTESVESDTKVSIKKPEMTFRVKGGRF